MGSQAKVDFSILPSDIHNNAPLLLLLSVFFSGKYSSEVFPVIFKLQAGLFNINVLLLWELLVMEVKSNAVKNNTA